MTYTQICDCNTENYIERKDPLLPDYVVILECGQCGFWVEYDTQDGEIMTE